jgi:hypothetical protein
MVGRGELVVVNGTGTRIDLRHVYSLARTRGKSPACGP